MMFSTKAEYGVRVMVELARRAGESPISLAEIAAHDGLPLAYLEHLVARLRKAGLVDSRRGSRGGYMLARPPGEITMAELVEALEGSISPIECISEGADGSIVCSRESEPGHACPTKLLWMRVRGSIVRTLEQTTLADLVLDPAPATGSVVPAGSTGTAGSAPKDGAALPSGPALPWIDTKPRPLDSPSRTVTTGA